MSRYTGPKHRLSRREGIDIFGTGGTSLQRRLNIPPGGQGKRRRKQTEYAGRLREKQKVKRMYGVQEKQFRRYFEAALRRKGQTGVLLLQTLESRLDNVIYRLGFARTRPMARQLVNHGHVQVDGHKVSIPSYTVRPGEKITLTEESMKIPGVVEATEDMAGLVPQWLERQDGVGRMLRLPYREEIDAHIREELIVEYYSR